MVDSSDTEPRADSSVVELRLDNGATVILWIDPDRGQPVVTEDLETWDVEDRGEFFDLPEVADDGEMTWLPG